MSISFPTITHRLCVIGKTGSGKTQFGAYVLSRAEFNIQPYVIVDYKGDDLLNGIDRAEQIGFKEVPKHPGVYILKPLPHETDEIEEWLWKVYQRERVGLYFDEMYMLPNPVKGGAMRSLFTQGRSKRIPVIGLTQRPRMVSRFLFTEADKFAIFRLTTRDDQITCESFLPSEVTDGATGRVVPVDLTVQPAPFHCRYFDDNTDGYAMLRPVPSADVILDAFETRLAPRRRIF